MTPLKHPGAPVDAGFVIGERSGPRGRSTKAPERNPELAHLSLVDLRRYRKALTDEENRVSYWRRLVQARLDLVRSSGPGHVGVDDLARTLTQERVGAGRTALLTVLPVDDMPPLPDLAGLWAQEVRRDDGRDAARLAEELDRAERDLSAYRAALHRRLAAATAELIARYHEDPRACLSALPLVPPARRARYVTAGEQLRHSR